MLAERDKEHLTKGANHKITTNNIIKNKITGNYFNSASANLRVSFNDIVSKSKETPKAK